MKDGYANPGQKPFQIDERFVGIGKDTKKRARIANIKYYKLGIKKKRHSLKKASLENAVESNTIPKILQVLKKCPKCNTDMDIIRTTCPKCF